MSNSKKIQASYARPSRAGIIRSVATSTAIETGQDSRRLEEEMKAKREKFGYLKLAI